MPGQMPGQMHEQGPEIARLVPEQNRESKAGALPFAGRAIATIVKFGRFRDGPGLSGAWWG
tara:strand:+ start:68 stop:250 length:183 start_codon:yes stop_codon:yes gene_type:complete